MSPTEIRQAIRREFKRRNTYYHPSFRILALIEVRKLIRALRALEA